MHFLLLFVFIIVIVVAIFIFIYCKRQNRRRQRLFEDDIIYFQLTELTDEWVRKKDEEENVRKNKKGKDYKRRNRKDNIYNKRRNKGKKQNNKRKTQENKQSKGENYQITHFTNILISVIIGRNQKKPIQQQIQILNQEINKLHKNNNLTNNQQQYYKNQQQQQLFKNQNNKAKLKSIPHVRQNIEISNPEVSLFVLKESLLREQNRELLRTSQEYSFGFDSIIGSFGSDQYCLKVRNTNLDYDKIVNGNQLLQQHLLDFQQQLSNSLDISIDQIEILGVSKRSFEISFNFQGNDMDSIYQQILKNKNERQRNSQINIIMEKLNIKSAKGVTLSSKDFNSSHNMSWDNFPKNEKRGPPNYRYDYYFPIGCYGFWLNIKEVVKEKGDD
ncbi:unnamed protein product [Paramecium octaurelia]|uniref:Transmembrane protein n=1 Tax=Paramecium octaurelia TaxID=43137 RepID=A0A8S1YMZ0_PAROT|nr:unnamed protein product [Paramecium octaurelia]